MRNKSKILKEIVELSGIKSAYNYYLGSSRSLTEVENATQVRQNRDTITKSLNILHSQLRHLQHVPTTPVAPEVMVRHSPAEQQAIISFNRDRRFSLTE